MNEGKVDLGFDWNREEEWKEYMKEIEELHKAMHRYIGMASYLRNLDGVSVSYGLAKSEIFYNEMTEPKTIWNDFIRDFYEVQVEQKDVGYGEKYRIRWLGGPFDTIEDYGILHEWAPGIHGMVMNSYLLLTQAGFKVNNEGKSSYESEEFLEAAEDLVRNILSLSPLVNRKTFFLLSLRYIPEGYARMMYGDLEKVKEILGWKRVTSWSVIPAAWQISTILDQRWRKITDMLHMLYGYAGTTHEMNLKYELWERIEKYIDVNPYNMYFSESLKDLGIAYKEDLELYHLVKGSWLPEGDMVYGEVSFKSLRDYEIKHWNIVDEFDDPKTEMKYDALIKFAAPQMFLNVATMYINVDGDWVIWMYIPKSFLTDEVTIERDEINAVPVIPPYMPKKALIPDGWRMHKLRDFLQAEKAQLEWMAMGTEEWEDYYGDEDV